MSPRYLMYISYIGKEFRGLQKLADGVRTVVGVIEDAMKDLELANDVKIVTSSRTDKGVHAIGNTMHVDLQHREPGAEYMADFITFHVNYAMCIQKLNLRIMKTLRVRDDFHSRFNAIGRTYVYRLTQCKKPQSYLVLPYSPFEYGRAHLSHKSSLDLELVQKTAEVLSGTHDFRAFTRPQQLLREPWINTIKTMEISIHPGNAFLHPYLPDSYHDALYNLDLVFKGSSFLYKQVLKMVAVMLAVGQGRLTLDQVRLMLMAPQAVHVRDTDIYNIPTHGLCLKEVLYNPSDLVYKPVEEPTKDNEEKRNTSIEVNGHDRVAEPS